VFEGHNSDLWFAKIGCIRYDLLEIRVKIEFVVKCGSVGHFDGVWQLISNPCLFAIKTFGTSNNF